jgi:hypothetical protein
MKFLWHVGSSLILHAKTVEANLNVDQPIWFMKAKQFDGFNLPIS